MFFKCMGVLNHIMMITAVATVDFEQSTYNVHEPDGSVQPVIVFSNPLSTAITVQVLGECTIDHL